MDIEAFIAARTALGYSQRGIAQVLGVESSTVSRWESGKTRIPAAIELALATLRRNAMPRTITSLNLDASDSPYKLADGLWLELRDGAWSLNDDNTSIAVEPSEDLDAITEQWLAATT